MPSKRLNCGNTIKECLECKHPDCIKTTGFKVCEEEKPFLDFRSNRTGLEYPKKYKERKAREKEREEQGLCTTCGKYPAEENRKACIYCLEKRRKAQQKRYAKIKAKREKVNGN